MVEIGLTGGIGSGKSSVAARLTDRGAVLIDADAIVRKLQAPGSTVVEAMVAEFGEGIVDDARALDRAAVARTVFADEDALRALNAIVHPTVHAEMTRRREAYRHTDRVVLLDIPLLKPDTYPDLAGVIVVDIPAEVAVARLVEFRGFSEEDAWARIANQISRDERRAIADFVIDNSGSLADLDRQVEECWAWIGTTTQPQPPTLE